MQDILTEIIATKKKEVARNKQLYPIEELRDCCHKPATRSMKRQLLESDSGIIAEFKRRSPSKGWIHREGDPAVTAIAYMQGGASAVSVLTDTVYFGGSTDDLRRVRPLTELPLLRKDFIIDPYQLYETAAMDADVVLLIAAALTPAQCGELAALAHELKLETLLEIHSEEELAYVGEHIDLVGVNNRNLGTFHTDIDNSRRLAHRLPAEKVRIAESGLRAPAEVKALREAGFRGFLMGEHFMRQQDPETALSDFIRKINEP